MRKLYDYHISKPIRFKNYWIFKPVRENCNRLFTFKKKKKKNVSLIYLNLSLKFSGFNSKNVFYFDIFCSIPGMYLKGIRLQYLLKLCAKHFVKNFRDLLFYSSGLLSLIGFNSFKWSQICSAGAFPSCYKDWKIPDPRLKDPEIQVHALWDQNLPICQEFEISIETFLGHFTSLSILIHWLFWPISGLYVVTCPPHLPSETAHRASCRTRNYKYCIMLHPYPNLIIRIHYEDILNRQFDQNIENSYATI